jgi:hypothetical protein
MPEISAKARICQNAVAKAISAIASDITSAPPIRNGRAP